MNCNNFWGVQYLHLHLVNVKGLLYVCDCMHVCASSPSKIQESNIRPACRTRQVAHAPFGVCVCVSGRVAARVIVGCVRVRWRESGCVCVDGHTHTHTHSNGLSHDKAALTRLWEVVGKSFLTVKFVIRKRNSIPTVSEK